MIKVDYEQMYGQKAVDNVSFKGKLQTVCFKVVQDRYYNLRACPHEIQKNDYLENTRFFQENTHKRKYFEVCVFLKLHVFFNCVFF